MKYRAKFVLVCTNCGRETMLELELSQGVRIVIECAHCGDEVMDFTFLAPEIGDEVDSQKRDILDRREEEHDQCQ